METRPGTTDDRSALERIYREVGWLEDDEATHLGPWLDDATILVAEVDGGAEALATRHRARMRVADADLPVAPVTSVAVSPVARRRGLAGILTARTVAAAAEDGAALAVLGMFDQGFYDRLGFGTGSTMLVHHFDPAHLRVDLPARRPVRLTLDDGDEVHETMMGRLRAHGGVVITDAGFTRGELGWTKPLVALGLRSSAGELTDLVWGEAKGEHGPWRVQGLVYRDTDGLMDLLGLLRVLSDQVHHVEVAQPPELSLQDLLETPFRHRQATEGAAHPTRARGFAYWQARVLDVPALVAARPWSGTPVRFTVDLADPLGDRDDVAWDGVRGDWTVELGAESAAERGARDDVPALRAGVGAFTRMLLGVAPASSLALTDDLVGPPSLLQSLDHALATPQRPQLGMWF